MTTQINVPKDCVKETATNIGAATITFTGTLATFRTFVSAFTDGDKTAYRIAHATIDEWEVGEGTYSAGTLTRVNIFASSNAGAKVTFTNGTVIVSAVEPASDKVGKYRLASTANGDGASTVGLEDADGDFEATQLEAAVAEYVHVNVGTALTDTATTTVQRAGRYTTFLLAGTMSQGETITLGTTGAVAGDRIRIIRTSTSAQTAAIVNGGAGAGTLVTLPASKVNFCEARFDGTNWLFWACGTQ